MRRINQSINITMYRMHTLRFAKNEMEKKMEKKGAVQKMIKE